MSSISAREMPYWAASSATPGVDEAGPLDVPHADIRAATRVSHTAADGPDPPLAYYPGMAQPVALNLAAVIAAVTADQPRVLTIPAAGGVPSRPGIPGGPLSDDHQTLERALRHLIVDQAGIEVGYVEQLYTFGDLDRGFTAGFRNVAVAYLALVREATTANDAEWVDWYQLLPWEDHRAGAPTVLTEEIMPALVDWSNGDTYLERRVAAAFGHGDVGFDGIRALDRYELLYEAGLVAERYQDAGKRLPLQLPDSVAMASDQRRVVATALGRLRGKLTYRPVVFELLSDEFTLLDLQTTVEALAGVRLHKQNFRRLVERTRLVEGTGRRATSTGGRPAEVFRFRPEVILERPRPGLNVPYR